MRRIVFQHHFTMMCMNNGLTERKSKSKTSAAVANWIAPSKEHFKNTLSLHDALPIFQKHVLLVHLRYRDRYR